MAGVIILSYGEGDCLVPKPADYKALIDVARNKFPELNGIDNDSISFHFTPEWFDGEVKLDRGAFDEVHNRAVLRITTTASALSQHIDDDDDKIQAGGVVGPCSNYLPDEMMSICVILVPTDRKVCFNMMPRTTLSWLKGGAATFFGVRQCDYVFEYQGEVLDDWNTPEGMAIEDGSLIGMHLDF